MPECRSVPVSKFSRRYPPAKLLFLVTADSSLRWVHVGRVPTAIAERSGLIPGPARAMLRASTVPEAL